MSHKSSTPPARQQYDGPIRGADGSIPRLQDGYYFAAGQSGEWHIIPDRQFGGIDWQVGLTALNNGAWLARVTGLAVYSQQYPTRQAALRAEVARLVRCARQNYREQSSPRMYAAQYQAVIAWAFSLLARPAPPLRISQPYKAELTEVGEQLLIPGCEARTTQAGKPEQLNLWDQ